MDLLDVIVVFSAISAAVGGWRLGFVARVTSWLGLALGLVIAARFLPTTVNAMRNSATTSQLLVVAGLLVGGAFVGQALGLLLGAQFHRLPLGPFRMADRGLGAIAGVVGVLVALCRHWPVRRDGPPGRRGAQCWLAPSIATRPALPTRCRRCAGSWVRASAPRCSPAWAGAAASDRRRRRLASRPTW